MQEDKYLNTLHNKICDLIIKGRNKLNKSNTKRKI